MWMIIGYLTALNGWHLKKTPGRLVDDGWVSFFITSKCLDPESILWAPGEALPYRLSYFLYSHKTPTNKPQSSHLSPLSCTF